MHLPYPTSRLLSMGQAALFGLLLALGPTALAAGPRFHHPDPITEQEFQNAYQDIRAAASKRGTATNDSAAAGDIGEYISAETGTASFPATDTYGDATSISLTAGDWLVFANWFGVDMKGATTTLIVMGISQTPGNDATGGYWITPYYVSSGLAFYRISAAIPSYRQSLLTTTPIYLKVYATYSGATPTYKAKLEAIRTR